MWVGRPFDPELLANIAALVRQELDREAAAGFPKLTRIPSRGVIRFLDYYASLPPAEHVPLRDVMARLGAMHFFPAPLIVKAHEEVRTTNPALLRMGAAMKSPPFTYGLRYEGLRMAKTILNDPESVARMKQTRSTLDFQPRDDPPKELVLDPDISRVQTAKAPLLRKLLNQSLTPLLGVKASKQPGGEIVYDGSIGGTPLKVSIIFSNLYAQTLYGATAKIYERNILAQRLTYETLWGTNTGWDYLTEENASRSIELLCELLRLFAGFMEQIASMPAGGL
jgi:hypothetical protein